jgi:hypothetical protein
MMFKYKGLAITLMMVLLIVVSVAGVSAGGTQAADSVSGAVDSANLVRTEDGLSLTLQASGLNAGNTITAWWIIDTSGDGAVPVGDVVCNAAGHQVGESGTFNIGSHIALEEVSEEVCFVFGSDEPPVIDTAALVEIHVVDHGSHLTGQNLVTSMNDFMTGSECCTLVGVAAFAAE